MTVIRRSNPLGERLALRRLLDGRNRLEKQPAGPANVRSGDEALAPLKGGQTTRELGT